MLDLVCNVLSKFEWSPSCKSVPCSEQHDLQVDDGALDLLDGVLERMSDLRESLVGSSMLGPICEQPGT
jgi:hypothetical protein